MNCVPIFTRLQETCAGRDCLFIKGVPSELNEMLRFGQLDLCPSSSIEYAGHPEKYLILRDLSISSFGPARSVYLFSRFPMENLDRRNVGLTRESATSVNLMKVILRKFYGYSNSFETARISSTDSLESFSAILLIGDSALKAGLQRNDGVYVYDLGELWYRHTGLPFVFALWIVRRETVRQDEGAVFRLHKQLCESKRHPCVTFENVAEDFKPEWIGKEDLVAYWETISYDLTPRHLEGLRTFYRFSAEMGLIEKEPPIDLFPST